MTVYLDEVFLVNLLMDWLVLWAVSTLAQQSSPWWRFALASVFGAVYSTAIFFPAMYWMTFLPVKIAWSLLILLLAFAFINWRNYLKLAIYFYLCAFVLGGASLASMYLFGEAAVQTWSGVALVETDFKPVWLAVGAGLVVAAVYCLRGRLRQDLGASQQVINAVVQLGEKQAAFALLADSGNSLTEPLSGRSVLVVEEKKLLPLFCAETQQTLTNEKIDVTERFLALSRRPELAGRWRIIPYQAVGQQGLLLGFRPDMIHLEYNGITKPLANITVALSAQKFSADGAYQGLIPLDLL